MFPNTNPQLLVIVSQLGGTIWTETGKADGGKGGGQERGHSKAGVGFLSQWPSVQESGEGLGPEGRDAGEEDRSSPLQCATPPFRAQDISPS
jgi:hypothetical protein